MPWKTCSRFNAVGVTSRTHAVGALLLLLLLQPALAAGPPPEDLRLNDIQVIGSHNSYKRAMPVERMDALSEADPDLAHALDYALVPLGGAARCNPVRVRIPCTLESVAPAAGPTAH